MNQTLILRERYWNDMEDAGLLIPMHQRRLDPSPEEIARRTAEIRETWSERTYRQRAYHSPRRVVIEPVSITRGRGKRLND